MTEREHLEAALANAQDRGDAALIEAVQAEIRKLNRREALGA